MFWYILCLDVKTTMQRLTSLSVNVDFYVVLVNNVYICYLTFPFAGEVSKTSFNVPLMFPRVFEVFMYICGLVSDEF